MNKCIFCKIAKGEIPSKKIYENKNFFSIFDVNPITKGHGLVISKKHFRTILELPDDLGADFLDCVQKTAIRILEQEKAEGFNLINNNSEVAGQLVHHFHAHIIPRKKGDGLKFI